MVFPTQSTKLESLTISILLVLLTACTKDGGSPPSKPEAKPPVTAPKETPEELSRRLRPRIERADEGQPTHDLAPLLQLDPALPLRTRLVLWSPRGEALPNDEQQKALDGLGRPLWSIVEENLLALTQNDPKPSGSPITDEVDGKLRLFGMQVLMDRPGLEALILLPRFWDNWVARFEKPLVAALPDRQHLLFLIDDPALLEQQKAQCQKLFEEAAEPLCDRWIRWDYDGKRLVPGPRFKD
ncbi:MAG: hypothetical protein R3F30_05475 [Planctomycetota bacterium]